MATIGRRAYAEIFGPTVGDRVRLADTELLIEVEADYTLRAGGYGEEVKFGGGKTIRDGMAQSQRTRAQGAVDTVLTNALILDHWGIVKADIGLKDGRIAAIGKAGNEILTDDGDHTLNPGRRTLTLVVQNTADRPIQVGSHYHFAETNGALGFDRDAARGMRLNIASGAAVRFEPGQQRTVELVDFSGDRIVYGFRGLVQGKL